MTRRRASLLVASLLTLGTACSESTSSPPGSADDTGATAAPTTATTTIPETTSTTSTTTTTSTTSTTSTTTTSTTVPPPTSAPPAVRELVLGADGLGTAQFGADPDGVVGYVSSLLGSPTGDTGWVDPFTFALCEGTEVRRVEWGVLSLLFGDVSSFANGRRHFYGWEYGLAGQIGDEPQGLRTAGGVGLGSAVVDLRAEFPDVTVNAGEEGLFPSNFYVNDNFRGLLTGAGDDDVVTVMFGGFGCGE